MAEAFVHTLRRDYFDEEALATGPDILRALGPIQQDYNTQGPHSALGMRAPLEYRPALAAGVVYPSTVSRQLGGRTPLSALPPLTLYCSTRSILFSGTNEAGRWH